MKPGVSKQTRVKHRQFPSTQFQASVCFVVSRYAQGTVYFNRVFPLSRPGKAELSPPYGANGDSRHRSRWNCLSCRYAILLQSLRGLQHLQGLRKNYIPFLCICMNTFTGNILTITVIIMKHPPYSFFTTVWHVVNLRIPDNIYRYNYRLSFF